MQEALTVLDSSGTQASSPAQVGHGLRSGDLQHGSGRKKGGRKHVEDDQPYTAAVEAYNSFLLGPCHLKDRKRCCLQFAPQLDSEVQV